VVLIGRKNWVDILLKSEGSSDFRLMTYAKLAPLVNNNSIFHQNYPYNVIKDNIIPILVLLAFPWKFQFVYEKLLPFFLVFLQRGEVYPSLAQNHNYVEIPESHLKADIVGHQLIVVDSHLSPGSFAVTNPGANF